MRLMLMAALIASGVFAGLKLDNGKVGPAVLKNYPVVSFIQDFARLSQTRITLGEALLKEVEGKTLNLTLNNSLNQNQFKNLFMAVLRDFRLMFYEEDGFAAVLEEKDVRYLPTEILPQEKIDPDREKYVMASFRTKYPLASKISRNLRPFISRYGRVVSLSDARLLLIQDTEKSIGALREVIATMDTNDAYQASLRAKKSDKEDKEVSGRQKILLKEIERLTLENLKLNNKLKGAKNE